MRLNNFISTGLAIASAVFFTCAAVMAQGNVTITVAPNSVVMQQPERLLGITFDARTGMSGYSGPLGYFNQNLGMLAPIAPLFGDFPITTVRYPANAVMFPFQWKKSVGPLPRAPQGILGTLGAAQSMDFGFDEFMQFVLQRGVNPADVQIMLGIYDSSIAWPKLAQQTAAIPHAAQAAADWVEYCNAPNDSVNRGGGINWAQKRAEYGRQAPYGIKIWNLGNEPWGPGEFGNDTAGANRYLATISPIIDSMRSRDTSIFITLPVTGPVTSPWNVTMRAFSRSRSGIYGLSPHFFPSEDTAAGAIPYGLNTIAPALKAIADSAAANRLKVIVGDFAHKIKLNPDGSPAEDPDIAMQWKGTNLTAEFLMMMSQINNIERADFWAYGLPKAQWHPIRYNGPGSYTLMPAAVLYKLFRPLFLEKSVSVTTTSPQSSDGNPYSVRASSFANSGASILNLIAVNRDKTRAYSVTVNGLAGYTVTTARLCTGASPVSDSITVTPVLPLPSGVFSLPPYGILIVEYAKAVSVTEGGSDNKKAIALFPNPAREGVWLSSPAATLRLFSVAGELLYSATGWVQSIPSGMLAPGVYVAVIDGKAQKLIIMR